VGPGPALPGVRLRGADVPATEVAGRIDRNADAWREVLAAPGASARPVPTTWSPLEYACHVRDVHLVFAERARAMLSQEDPSFPNWDQDEAAVSGDYARQQPQRVADELVAAAGRVSEVYRDVPASGWQRPGRRSNGSRFTVESLARYHLHDVEHHLFDVSR
jgi:DinB superfamily